MSVKTKPVRRGKEKWVEYINSIEGIGTIHKITILTLILEQLGAVINSIILKIIILQKIAYFKKLLRSYAYQLTHL